MSVPLQPAVFPPVPVEGYTLLDSGHGEKLERFGEWVLRRPDPQAMWRPRLDPDAWAFADLAFVRESDRGGRWEPGPRGRAPPEDGWSLEHDGAQLVVRPTPFKHVGLFPEQACNWAFTAERLAGLRSDDPGDPRPRVLNLFAYTGAATVFAARAGAFVTHVDASKPSMRWAKDNALRTGLPGDAVRWIQDDALEFAQRELRRGKRYEAVLLDPPPYGRSPDGKRWEFETGIVPLLEAVAALLADTPGAFCVLSCYAVGTSPLAFANMLAELGPGRVDAGELALPEADGARALPAGLCGRWVRG